jgi:hypothetical protein
MTDQRSDKGRGKRGKGGAEVKYKKGRAAQWKGRQRRQAGSAGSRGEYQP